MMTKDEARRILSEPNGSEKLFEHAHAAFDAACALFVEEGSRQAAAFLVRSAKQKEYKEKLLSMDALDAALLASLRDDDPKLRKNAARLMGELKKAAYAGPLILALRCEAQEYARPSMLLALGAIGTPEAVEALAAFSAGVGEDKHAKAQREALRAARALNVPPPVHGFSGLGRAYEIELRTPDRLSGVAAEELRALRFSPDIVSRDAVRVRTEDLSRVYRARCFHEALFPVAMGVPADGRAIADAAQGALLSLLQDSSDAPGPYGYRIEVRGVTDRGSLAKAIAASIGDDALVNAPSSYDAELRVEIYGDRANLFLKLYTCRDPRFPYRKHTLPASIHPATAAAVLRYALGKPEKGKRVLDPCCGSGTMLFERERLAPCAALTGVDIAKDAIAMARENADAGKSAAQFVRSDLSDFTAHRAYDEVIANLPFGNRVGSHEKNERLYAALLDKLPAWLKPGGIAVLYTMEFTLLKTLVREREKTLELLSQGTTAAGGLMPGIFLLKRK